MLDLDGTLVETEILKAQSYAYAASVVVGQREASSDHSFLCPQKSPSPTSRSEVEAAMQAPSASPKAQACANVAFQCFLDNIGGTSREISQSIVDRLELHNQLGEQMERFGVSEPWEALYKLRKEVYYERFGTEEKIFGARYERNINILRAARRAGIDVAVATSSKTDDAERVLRVLGVADELSVINGVDKVECPKPNPEVYLKTVGDLGQHPHCCIVFEDSVTGVTAAAKAGTKVIGLANEFTAPQLREQRELDQQWIVYDDATLESIIRKRVASMTMP